MKQPSVRPCLEELFQRILPAADSMLAQIPAPLHGDFQPVSVSMPAESASRLNLADMAVSSGYQIQKLAVGQNTEYRIFHDGFHFGSIIVDPVGRVIIRYHPDQHDENGWGFSHHIASFLAGGDPSQGTVDDIQATATGIEVWASGRIATATGTFGTWTWHATIRYDAVNERVTGEGTRTVSLPQVLSSIDKDLNLELIPSNLLDNIVRQTDGRGDTGDTGGILVRRAPEGSSSDFFWQGEPPAHFPQDLSTFLSVNVLGALNTVEAKGVKVALKPTYRLDITSSSELMIIGLVFDQSQNQNFAADNVGITPLILQSAASTEMTFDFAFTAEKPALTIFSDDFRRTDKGGRFEGQAVNLLRGPSNHAPWVLRQGNLRIAANVLTAGSNWSRATINGLTGTDVTIRADVDVRTATVRKIAGFLARGRYRVLVVGSPTPFFVGGSRVTRTVISIQVFRENAWVTLGSKRVLEARGRLVFELTGNQVTVRYRGATVLKVNDSTFNGPGEVGVLGQSGVFDNFQVTVRDLPSNSATVVAAGGKLFSSAQPSVKKQNAAYARRLDKVGTDGHVIARSTLDQARMPFGKATLDWFFAKSGIDIF